MSTQITISPEIKLVVNTTPITGGSAGQILFQTTGNTVGESSNLFWDNAKNIAGIGTNAPFSGATNVISSLQLGASASNLNVGGFCSLGKITVNGYGAVGSNYYLDSNNFLRRTNSDSVSILDFSAAGFYFRNASGGGANTTIALNELASIRANGNVLINTSVDAGYKLDVNGRGRFLNGIELAKSGYVGFINDGLYSSMGYNTLPEDISTVLKIGFGAGTSVTTLLKLDNTTNSTFAGPATVLLDILANPSQTAPLLQWRNSAGAVLGVISSAGNVGIGTSSPAYVLDVVGGFRIGSSTIKLGMGESGGNSVFVGSLTNQPLKFLVNTNEYARIATTGNVLINTTGDSGFRLDVNGTARVQGLITGTAGITISGSSSFTSGYLGIASTGSGGIYGLTANQPLYIWNRQTSTGNGIVIDDFNGVGANSISLNLLNISGSYNTSGTCVHNTLMISRAINMPLGNQTVRGFYYNPTLTNTTGLVAHFAFHSTSGRVRFEGLPTSSVGLSSGDIWNDGGIVKIV